MSNTGNEIQTRQETVQDTTILSPTGRLDYDASAEFQSALEDAVAQGAGTSPGIIVDCAKLGYISSAGLRAFLVGAREAKAAGLAFVICDLSPAVQEVFAVSGFDRTIPVHPNRDAALAALSTNGG